MSKYYSDETAKRICNLVGFKPNWTDKEVVSEILQRLESTPEQQALRRDAERLDFLDDCSRAMNQANGSRYGWKFDWNHLRVAMMLVDRQSGIAAASLNDAGRPESNVRTAIDGAREKVLGAQRDKARDA